MEELSSHKGLDAYNQFVSGFVSNVGCCLINDKCVVTSKVCSCFSILTNQLTHFLNDFGIWLLKSNFIVPITMGVYIYVILILMSAQFLQNRAINFIYM